MAIWDIALSGAEIASLATSGTFPTDVQAGHIVFRPIWSGSSVIDAVSGATLTATNITSSADLPS